MKLRIGSFIALQVAGLIVSCALSTTPALALDGDSQAATRSLDRMDKPSLNGGTKLSKDAESSEYGRLMQLGIDEGLHLGAELIAGTKDGVQLHESLGFASASPARPWTKDGLVDMASVTKVMATSTAVLICRERGLLDTNAPISHYLPECNPEAGAVSLAQLATHCGGFDNGKRFFREYFGKEIREAICKEKPLRKPDTKFEYACVDMMLLGLAVEAVSGRKLDEFCLNEIYRPLKMPDTSFGPLDRRDGRLVKMATVAPGLISDEIARYANSSIGNAGLFSSAPDIARFCRMILNGGELDGVRILSQDSLGLFMKRLNPEPLPARSFGWDMGQDRRPDCMSDRSILHSGWTGQTVFIDPENGIFVAVLTNRMGDHAKAMENRRQIANAAAKAVIARASRQ